MFFIFLEPLAIIFSIYGKLPEIQPQNIEVIFSANQ